MVGGPTGTRPPSPLDVPDPAETATGKKGLTHGGTWADRAARGRRVGTGSGRFPRRLGCGLAAMKRTLLEVVVVEAVVFVEGLLYHFRQLGHGLSPQVHVAPLVAGPEYVLPPRVRLLGEVLAVVSAARLLADEGSAHDGLGRDEHQGRRYLTNPRGEYESLIAAQGTFAGDQIHPVPASSWQESVPALSLTVERLHRRFEFARVQRAIMGLCREQAGPSELVEG